MSKAQRQAWNAYRGMDDDSARTLKYAVELARSAAKQQGVEVEFDQWFTTQRDRSRTVAKIIDEQP